MKSLLQYIPTELPKLSVFFSSSIDRFNPSNRIEYTSLDMIERTVSFMQKGMRRNLCAIYTTSQLCTNSFSASPGSNLQIRKVRKGKHKLNRSLRFGLALMVGRMNPYHNKINLNCQHDFGSFSICSEYWQYVVTGLIKPPRKG